MPLYTFKCPRCGEVKEEIVKYGTSVQHYCNDLDNEKEAYPVMELVLSTPSAPQWNCRTAHSRSKGF